MLGGDTSFVKEFEKEMLNVDSTHLPKGLVEVNNIEWDALIDAQNMQGQGSNAWTISGKYTQNQKPLLASDPHLAVGLPCVWMMSHLRCTNSDFNITGVSLVATAFISVGFNPNLAFGVTLSYCDVADVFLEKMHPQDELKYEFCGEWKDIKVTEELINVKGHDQPKVIRVKETHHGPIIDIIKKDLLSHVQGHENYSFALQASFFMESDKNQFILQPFFDINKAKNWAEFSEACSKIQPLSLNINYADKKGNIGYVMTGEPSFRCFAFSSLFHNKYFFFSE